MNEYQQKLRDEKAKQCVVLRLGLSNPMEHDERCAFNAYKAGYTEAMDAAAVLENALQKIFDEPEYRCQCEFVAEKALDTYRGEND